MAESNDLKIASGETPRPFLVLVDTIRSNAFAIRQEEVYLCGLHTGISWPSGPIVGSCRQLAPACRA